jgi:hypothetical protein
MTDGEASATEAARPTVRASCERIGAELFNLVRALGPSDEVRTHFRAARVEILKGFRAAIDARIERAMEGQRKGRSVTIE